MSYIGNEPIVSATRTITEIVATAGQTVFVANGGYTVGFIDVFVNGAQLQTSDFTATNGSSITLNSGATASDDIRLVAWGTFSAGAVNGGSIIDSTVTAAKLASSSVTQAKLGSNVAGNGPTFAAWQSVQQTIASSATPTKITFTTVEFDTNSNFASSRFTPTVAGYYQVSAGVNINTATWVNVILFKNGTNYKNLTNSYPTTLNGGFGSALVYCNGTTDYIEIYCSVGASSVSLYNNIAGTYFQASMVRAA